ncbi:MAG TPA: Ppx/GppA phosphatase family protein [Candidatus Obscuribacterales bacterium]
MPSNASNKSEKSARSGSWVQLEGGPVLACVDMGTNSFHMIVCRASPKRDHFEVITRVKEAAPFFRRSLVDHYIDEASLRSCIRILKDMQKKAYEKGADTILAVATSAVRESRNGAEVLHSIRDELEIDARMISGKEEARLIYLGVLWSMPRIKGRFGIVDIGGGSTELIIGDRQKIDFAESYKLGAARLTQRFFKKGQPTPETLRELHDEVRGVLRPAAARLEELGGVPVLVGTSGTIQALAKLDREREGKSNQELNGWRLPLSRLEKIVLTIEETALEGDRIKGVSADRNQTVLAGSIVLLETMRSLNINEITVSTAALREGVVIDRFLQTGWLDGGLEHHRDPRSSSVHALIEKYHASFEHAEQVARLASEIFRQTRGVLHEYSTYVGHLIWSAAMLHDVGMFIGRNGHHKHSYYLIKNGGLLGHSEEEVGIIASIARYHRGSPPKESHEAFYTIAPENRKLVTDMAAILRVAEALDRSHRQVIDQLTVAVEPFQKGGYDRPLLSFILKLKPGENCYSESWALDEKKEFFENQFGVRLNLSVSVQAEEAYPVKSTGSPSKQRA